MTKFVHERLFVGPGLSLVIDGNSKVTGANGTYDAPTPNAFSLPAASVSNAGYCPGSTSACRDSCYVRGLAKHAPDVYRAYTENAVALATILSGTSYQLTESAFMLGAWIAANAKHGFRWHVSGDVWNETHARWIARACFASRDVRHWIYTRTLDGVVLRYLMVPDNLSVNISADVDNYQQARVAAQVFGARLCYMATGDGAIPSDLPDGSVIFPDYSLRGRELDDPTQHTWWQGLPQKHRLQVCPADFFGQSEAHRCGPCTKCLVRA